MMQGFCFLPIVSSIVEIRKAALVVHLPGMQYEELEISLQYKVELEKLDLC